MRITNYLAFLFLLVATGLNGQISFTNHVSLLNPEDHYSGVAIAVLDMNGDGRDDIARMDDGTILSIAIQEAPNSPFSFIMVQDLASNSQWGMCAADIDNNHYADVLAGGRYDNVKIAMANSDGTAYSVLQITDPSTFVQGVNFADINNDGWLDAFVCHDDGPSRVYGNDGTGNLVYQPGWMDFTTYPNSDMSGNYGTIWCDFDNDGDTDLYIAKCRQGVNSPSDGRRINMLFVNNNDGTYSQDTANVSGLRIGAQSWTADFGDIDNDGDFDCFITNHDVNSMLLENDGSGHFTDISTASGVAAGVGGTPIQGVMRDFDNDGYLDIIVAGSQQFLLRNNGDKTFSPVDGAFDNEDMESFAIGDLNSDGFLDIYGGYANIYTTPSNTPDALWLNDGNDNHYFGMNLRGVMSNYSAVGAKVDLYSALGHQVREVRSGESYGIMNSLQIHFGMGAVETIDSVVVEWPSGHIDRLYNPLVDQYVSLEEGGCLVPQVSIEALTPSTICTGETVTIGAPAGFTAYAWDNGATTQEIMVSEEGNYTVTVTNDMGCTAISNAVAVVVDPVEIPTIQVDGDTLFCSGGSVTLTSSPANAYVWSNGETTQSIVVSEAGAYSVSAEGLCEFFSSSDVNVTVNMAADPAPQPDTVLVDMAATLTATGDSLLWYDQASGGNPIGSGTSFTTPLLTESTTYWVQHIQSFDQPNVHVGPTQHQGSNYSGSQFNAGVVFDCQQAVQLKSVKVITEFEGERRIVLQDENGNELQAATVSIPSGETVVDLNFDIPVGTNLYLTTDQATNQTSFGTNSPQLRRSDQGVSYPYSVANVISLTGSSLGGATRFYYFYDWEIDFYGIECAGDLVPVTAVVDLSSAAHEVLEGASVEVSPNPTTAWVKADLKGLPTGNIRFAVYNAQGMLVQENYWNNKWQNNSQQIDLSNCAKGVYQLVWSHEKGILRQTVVVQ
jgi:hypothetical protein